MDEIHNNVHKDHRSTILEIAGRVVLPYGTHWRILRKDLNLQQISAKFVPYWQFEATKYSCGSTSSLLV